LSLESPFVNLPDSISVKCQAGFTDLAYYAASHLLKIFLSAAQDHGVINHIYDEKTAELVEVPKYQFYDNGERVPKIKIYSSPKKVEEVLHHLCSKEPELAPLFDQFKDFIINSSYDILVDPPQCESASGGSGDGEESEEGNEGEGEGQGQGQGEGEGEDANGKGQGQGQGEDGEGEEKKGQGQGQGQGDGKGNGKPQPITAEMRKVVGGMMSDELNKISKGVSSYSYSTGNFTAGCDVVPSFKLVKKQTTPTRFYDHEKSAGEKLLKMLDITWDSDKDVVKSLRMGKIDITKIAEVPAGNVAVYQREMEEMSTKPFSVCILVDESGSMGDCRPNEKHYYYAEDGKGGAKKVYGYERATAAYHLIKSLYVAFSQILPPDKLYVYGHTTGGPTGAQVFTYHDPYNQNFEHTIDDMIRRGRGSNYDGPVVKAIHEKVRTLTEDRIIFIVLSDGSPAGHNYGSAEDIKDFKRIVERAKRDEFVTAGIFIQYAGEKDMYNYHTIVQDMDEMPKKVSHLLNKIVKTEFQ